MDLGPFHDLPKALRFAPPEKPTINQSELFRQFGALPNFPTDFQIERGKTWIFEGVSMTELSWNVGWGPRTQAFLLKPEGVSTPLPGVLFLHSHDDVKEFGKEKVVAGSVELPDELQWVRRDHYGNQAPANELAKRGYAVVAFDCFLWGSRRFPKDVVPARLKEVLESDDYERLAVMHESMILSKYLSLFGATLAGLLNFDDRVALAVAHSLPEISESVSAVGLSGGGCRGIYLHATSSAENLRCTVSVGAMATYESMLGCHVAPHSWMFFPHNLAAVSDWPGVALIGAPKPLYLQFCGEDQLFTSAGMRRSHEIIAEYYSQINADYRGDFYPVKHSFTAQMQKDAFDWMDRQIKTNSL
jgi:hypothetical protein